MGEKQPKDWWTVSELAREAKVDSGYIQDYTTTTTTTMLIATPMAMLTDMVTAAPTTPLTPMLGL